MKKFFVFLLSILIVFSGGTMAFAVEYIDGGINKDSSAPLLTDVITNIKTYDGAVGTPMFFRLIPSDTDFFTIETTGTVDTEGELYNSSGNSLEVQDDVVGANFQIHRQLMAGETYYLRVTNYSGISGDETTLRVAADGIGGLSAPPTATVQPITGTLQVGETLTGYYIYSDVNGDTEGTSTYKWYRSDNALGLNKTEIAGETSITYVLQAADTGKYISFEVTPVAQTGTLQGTAVESEKVGAIVGDTTAPAGYSIVIDQGSINNASQTAMSFTFSGAEVGSAYNYVVSSSGGGSINGSGPVSTANQEVTGIDTSTLGDGTLTLSVTLTDTDGNVGTAATDTVSKDATAPTGYSVAIDHAVINNDNKTAMSFAFGGAEVGSTYNYTVSSSGGGTNVTGSGTITVATQQITGIDISGLGDGTLTLSITLTDTAGNIGTAATDTVIKDADAPSGYSVNIDQASIDNTNKTTMSFTLAAAEVGATYNYTVSSSGGAGTVTGSGTITVATQQITGINTTSLPDGTLTLSVTLTDTTENIGTAATDTVTKDTIVEAAPTATVQAITGILQVGETLTGHYTYSDVNGDIEGTSTYKWYRSDDSAGLNKTVIPGETTITYALQSADTGKYISFEVTPVAATGTAQGTAVESAKSGPVGDITVPTVAIGAVNRTSDTTGTVKFTSSEVGSYYYAVTEDEAGEPVIDISGAGTTCTTEETIITNPTGLTVGAKDIYIKVKNAAGNVSIAFKIDIDAYMSVSSDATLKVSSTVKGQTVTGLGTPNSTLGSETAGAVTIKAEKAADTSNASSFITLFDKNNANATLKVVKYASGTSTANFATDTAYANGVISNGDFFIIKVIAQDTTTVNYYRVNVAVTTASSGSSGGGGGSTTTPTTQTVNVVVNGKTENAGTETNSTENGKSTVKVAVNNKVIESKINEAVKSNTTGQQNVIQVPVADTKSDVVKVELTGDIVKQLETNTFDVSVKRDAVEYVIPAKELTISNVAKELGVAETSLKDIKVEVQITKLEDSVVAKYNEVAKANGAQLVFPPTAFEVVAKTTNAAGKTEDVKISKFSNYVERVMEIPTGLDPSKITTGIVFNSDGTYSHIPTDVYQKDGKWYARLNSLTNSNYSVVWNPVTVKSVENHWAKDAVNDMASRLVVFNAETFEPNKAITRADFAEYIVRALGIYREATHENKFKDVSATGDRTLAVLIANEYGIVTGYSDGTFRGDNQITREEAMAMYQRAMKVTKLTGSDTNRYQSYTDYTKVSGWAANYVKEVLSAHVFNGTTATTISPKSNLTYAESAQAIKNLLVESKLINK